MNQLSPGVFAERQRFGVDVQILSEFRNYLRANNADLVKCCAWLGDPVWGLRAARLIVALRQTAFPRPQQLKELHALLRLLSLELIDDFNSLEAARFAELDLSDARLERCCMHCEAVAEFLAAVGATDDVLSAAA